MFLLVDNTARTCFAVNRQSKVDDTAFLPRGGIIIVNVLLY